MRDLGAALNAHLSTRKGVSVGLLIWQAGRNRASNQVEYFGFWTGPESMIFTIGGAPRTYLGVGSVKSVSPIIAEVGLNVRTTRITLDPLNANVIAALRGYDPRGLPCEIHVQHFGLGGGDAIGDPVQVGYTETSGLTISDVGPGEQASAELAVRSRASFLTRKLPLKKSDADFRKRQPADGFRRYIDVSGQIEAVWGAKRAKS